MAEQRRADQPAENSKPDRTTDFSSFLKDNMSSYQEAVSSQTDSSKLHPVTISGLDSADGVQASGASAQGGDVQTQGGALPKRADVPTQSGELPKQVGDAPAAADAVGAAAIETDPKAPGRHENADGSSYTIDKNGHIVETTDANGLTRNYKFEGDKLVSISSANGTWNRTDKNEWTKEGSAEKWNGDMFVTANGGLGYKTSEGIGVYHLDGMRAFERPDGSMAVFDKDNHAVLLRDSAGKERKLEWKDGQISRMTSPDGQVWTNEGNNRWTNPNQKDWFGTMSVLGNGTFVETNPDGSKHFFKHDGTYEKVNFQSASNAADAIANAVGSFTTDDNAIRKQLEHTSEEFRAMVDSIYRDRHGNQGVEDLLRAANEPDLIGLFMKKDGVSHWDQLEKDADAIQAACNEGGFLWTGGGTSEENIYETLKNKSPEDRKLIDEIFERKYGWKYGNDWGLEKEFRDEMSEGSFELTKAISLLDQGEGDSAGQIRVALLERDATFSANRNNAACEQDIRDTVRTMTGDQLEDLKKTYKQRYGRDLVEDLIGDESNLSAPTKAALRTYLGDAQNPGGSDHLSDQDFADLAKHACQSGDLTMFKEALSSAPETARQLFLNQDGLKYLTAAFSGYELNHAFDYLVDGKLSRGTQIGDSISWMGDNERDIESILREFSVSERKNYVTGKALATGETVSGLTKEQQDEAQRFYKSVHDALESGADATEMKKWEGMIDGTYSEEAKPDKTEAEIRQVMESTASLEDKMQSFNHYINDDEIGVYTALTMASQAELAAITANPQQYLSFLSPEERQIALNIAAQHGEFRPEDKMRAYTLGAGTSEEDIHRVLKGLKPAELEQMKQDYAAKYGTSLTTTLISELGGGDEIQAMGEVRTPASTVRGTFDDARGELYLTRQGPGSWLVDHMWDGTGFHADELNNAFARSMMAQDSSLSLDQAQKMADDLSTALDSFRDSKSAMGQAGADVVLAAIAIACAVVPGTQGITAGILTRLGSVATRIPGMIELSEGAQLAAGAALAGGTVRTTIQTGAMGSDYDGSGAPIDFASGAVDALASLITPSALGKFIGVGAEVAEDTAGHTIAGILKRMALNAPGGALGGLAGAVVRLNPDLSMEENIHSLKVSTLTALGAAGVFSFATDLLRFGRSAVGGIGRATSEAGEGVAHELDDALGRTATAGGNTTGGSSSGIGSGELPSAESGGSGTVPEGSATAETGTSVQETSSSTAPDAAPNPEVSDGSSVSDFTPDARTASSSSSPEASLDADTTNGATDSPSESGPALPSSAPDPTAPAHVQLTEAADQLAATLEQHGISSDSIDSLLETSQRLAEGVSPEKWAHLSEENAGYMREITEAIEAGRITSQEHVDALLDIIDANLSPVGNAQSLEGAMDAFVRSPNAAENMEQMLNWADNGPRRGSLSPVGDPPQLEYLGLRGWKVEGVDGNGALVLRHNGEMQVNGSDLANKDVGSKFDVISGPDDNGVYTVRPKSWGETAGAPVELVVTADPADLLMETMAANNGGENVCTAAVTSFLMNASNPEGLAKLIADGGILTPASLMETIGRVGDGGRNVNLGELLGMIEESTGMATRAIVPPSLDGVEPGLYVATVNGGSTNVNQVTQHTELIAVDADGNGWILDPANGKRRPLAAAADLQSLNQLTGEPAEQAAANLGLTGEPAGATPAVTQPQGSAPGAVTGQSNPPIAVDGNGTQPEASDLQSLDPVSTPSGEILTPSTSSKAKPSGVPFNIPRPSAPPVSGQSHPVLLIEGSRKVFDKDVTQLGRGSDSDVTLKDDRVSWKHAALRRDCNKFLLTDLSTNGTMANQQLMNGETEIKAGDRILLGRKFDAPILKFGESVVDPELRNLSPLDVTGPLTAKALQQEVGIPYRPLYRDALPAKLRQTGIQHKQNL